LVLSAADRPTIGDGSAAHQIGNARKDKRGVDLISHGLPFGRLSYGELNAIRSAQHRRQSRNAVIRVHNARSVIETHQHAGNFKEV
jgi:predicted aconitase